ncbi:cysteine proteinase inhibitor 1-like [Malus sylvestris]|uniref:cysteine proteinase inhibitor 1-like n=1 Tax=Malus sylvestris TaxID=3752 RepID=UPI0021ABDBD7|nr:cysteine proteinase inhibitor 1-like [Malus sylvestris]
MGMYHPNCLLLVLTALLYVSATATTYEGVEGGEEHNYPPKYPPPSPPLRGGYFPIRNLSYPHLREITEFALSKYNKIHNQKLVLQKLVQGQYQIVSGVNYKLIIAVVDSSLVNSGPINYEIIVFEKPWMNIKKLKSFIRVQINKL